MTHRNYSKFAGSIFFCVSQVCSGDTPIPPSISCQSDPRRTPTPCFAEWFHPAGLRSVLVKRCLRLRCLRPHNLCSCPLRGVKLPASNSTSVFESTSNSDGIHCFLAGRRGRLMPVAGLVPTAGGISNSEGQSEYCFARAAGKERHCNRLMMPTPADFDEIAPA